LIQQGEDDGVESFTGAEGIYERLFLIAWFQLQNYVVEELVGEAEERSARWQIKRNGWGWKTSKMIVLQPAFNVRTLICIPEKRIVFVWERDRCGFEVRSGLLVHVE
jgi:hypothetical protein